MENNEMFCITSLSLAAYLKTLGIEPVNIIHVAKGQIVLLYTKDDKLNEALKKYDNDTFLKQYKKHYGEFKKIARYGQVEKDGQTNSED